MLPSRGLIRPNAALGFVKASLAKPSARTPLRNFGTALRRINGNILRGELPSSRIASRPLLSGASLQTGFSLRQARNASTQPTTSTASAAAASSPSAATDSSVPLPDLTATPVNLSGSDLLDIPEQIGFLKTLGLDYGWGPTSLMQTLLESIYVYTGLPWWGSIALLAVAIRLAILKPTIDASENVQKLQELQKDPRYVAATEQLKQVMVTGNYLAGAEARARVSLMHKEAGYQPWKNLINLIQLPIGIGMFRLVRGMAALPVPSFETGGTLWFTDLAVSDPYFVLPIITGLFVAQAMRIPMPYMAPQQQKTFKAMALIMTPFTTVVSLFLPAGIQWYFCVTSFLHMIQQWFLHRPWFRRWVGLRPLNKTNPMGITWEPPRVVDTKAPRVKTEVPTAVPKNQDSSLYSSIKSTIELAKEKMESQSTKAALERAQKAAQEYEERRALEEKEKYLARINAKRSKNH